MLPKTKTSLRGSAVTSEGPYKSKTAATWESIPNKPLLLSYLFWYFSHTTEFPLREGSRGVQIHAMLKSLGLVKTRSERSDEEDDEEWVITEKGNALVQHILDVPLPQQKITWVMPGTEDS